MEQMLVKFGLIMIGAGAILGPFIVKKIEDNFEAFLLLIGLCAVAISRSWYGNTIRETLLNPLVFGMILSLLLIGAVIRYQEPCFERMNNSILKGFTLKVIFFGIVVMLGLLAGIITPILSLFVLMEVVTLLPLKRRARAGVTILTGLSIGLGAILNIFDEPFSTISAAKTLNESYLMNSILLLNLPGSYLILCILVLGLIAMFVTGDKMTVMETQSSKCEMPPNNITMGARACMFVGALVLAGLAFSP